MQSLQVPCKRSAACQPAGGGGYDGCVRTHEVRGVEIAAAHPGAGIADAGRGLGTGVSSDTSADMSAKQFELLRRMGLEGRVQLTFSLMDNATELALAGIRTQEPGLSIERERWLLMVRRYGRDLALSVLGDEPLRR